MEDVSPKRPTFVDQHVGRKVKKARKEKGLTQAELGQCVGVTHQQIQRYESGTTRISCGQLYAIAKALRQPIDWFYEGASPGQTLNIDDQKRQAFQDCMTILSQVDSVDRLETIRGLLRLAVSPHSG